MSKIEARLVELGLKLPPPVKPPPGVVLPFRFVRVHHAPDGTFRFAQRDADRVHLLQRADERRLRP